METFEKINRRDFLKAGAVLSSFFIVPRHVMGGVGYVAPSDKITLGFIGCGRQSGGLRNRFLDTQQAQIVAASDVYRIKQETFVNATNKWYADKSGQAKYKSAVGIEDFRNLLDRKDIDAVVIASPDHWHASMAVRAAEAGKDIYCEKPLSLTVKEGRAMVNATRKHNRVFQTGSMQRSSKEFRQAVELVRSGAIGELKKIYVNVGGPPKVWDLQEETLPDGLNWDLWMGPNSGRAFNNELAPAMDAKFWPRWRDYQEFGGGGMTDWGAHMFDIGQWGMNMDHSGPVELIYTEPTQGLVYKYENGVEMIHRPIEGSKQHCHFVGTQGEVWVARGELKTTPETLSTKIFKDGATGVYASDNHYQDFLTSIRTRKAPICDVEVGHRTASVCNLGNIVYRLQRSLKWNPDKEIFVKDKEADKLLGREMRKTWRV